MTPPGGPDVEDPTAGPDRPRTSLAELRRLVAGPGVPPGRRGRGPPIGPGRARPRDELHRHLAVLRPGDERMPARGRAPGGPARQLPARLQARPLRPGALRLL